MPGTLVSRVRLRRTEERKRVNQREKIMAGVVGGVALLWGGNTAKTQYVETLEQLDRQIESKTRELKEVEHNQEAANKGILEWDAFGSHTLSMDTSEAKNLLRRELLALTDRTGLGEDSHVDLQQVSSWSKSKIRLLGASVKAEGKLDVIAQFLFQLHRQPYQIRCKRVTLTPRIEQERKGRSKPRYAPKENPHMSLTVDLDTPILPPLTKIEKIKPVNLDRDPEGGRQEVSRRLRFQALAEYTNINSARFHPFIPPPPPPSKATGPTPANNAPNVAVNTTLKWKPGARTQTHLIYFSKDRDLKEAVATQPAATFKPSETLAQNETYFWRVDEKGVSGTTRGDVWRFTTVKPGQKPVETQPEQKTEPPKPTPPPADADMIVRGLLSGPLGQQVVLQAPRKKTDKRVEVGDEIFGGTLILVHSTGAVSERSDGSRRFHAVGEPLKQGQPLTEEEHPVVYHELAKLEQRAMSINKQPG